MVSQPALDSPQATWEVHAHGAMGEARPLNSGFVRGAGVLGFWSAHGSVRGVVCPAPYGGLLHPGTTDKLPLELCHPRAPPGQL